MVFRVQLTLSDGRRDQSLWIYRSVSHYSVSVMFNRRVCFMAVTDRGIRLIYAIMPLLALQ